MNDKQKFELIEGFIDGNLHGDELTDFEKKLQNDPELQKEVNLHREVNVAIMEDDVMNLRDKLQSIRFSSEVSEKRSLLRLSLNKWQLVAASVVLLIALVSVLLPQNSRSYNSMEIYNIYYTSYGAVGSIRSQSDVSNPLNDALRYYEAKKYSLALEYFKKVLDKDSLDIVGNFYSGISNIEVKKYKLAEINFNKVIKHEQNLYVQQSEWYLGLCYLAMNDKEKAIKQFSTIVQNNSFYKNKAEEILNKLD